MISLIISSNTKKQGRNIDFLGEKDNNDKKSILRKYNIREEVRESWKRKILIGPILDSAIFRLIRDMYPTIRMAPGMTVF